MKFTSLKKTGRIPPGHFKEAMDIYYNCTKLAIFTAPFTLKISEVKLMGEFVILTTLEHTKVSINI